MDASKAAEVVLHVHARLRACNHAMYVLYPRAAASASAIVNGSESLSHSASIPSFSSFKLD